MTTILFCTLRLCPTKLVKIQAVGLNYYGQSSWDKIESERKIPMGSMFTINNYTVEAFNKEVHLKPYFYSVSRMSLPITRNKENVKKKSQNVI